MEVDGRLWNIRVKFLTSVTIWAWERARDCSESSCGSGDGEPSAGLGGRPLRFLGSVLSIVICCVEEKLKCLLLLPGAVWTALGLSALFMPKSGGAPYLDIWNYACAIPYAKKKGYIVSPR